MFPHTTAIKAPPIARAMTNPVKVPAQIWILMRRINFLTRSSASLSFSLGAESEAMGSVSSRVAESISCVDGTLLDKPRRPVLMSCSTKERRTETMMAASTVSPGYVQLVELRYRTTAQTHGR